ncbi:MAG TPA: FGGY-family carbohydrate kinase [Dehalococcoidia bacterium]|nr:FGGY-family carbohydrate kinase [Dehalococcoidia bacterium]
MSGREPHVVGIDAGSTGVRCLVVSVSGHPAASARRAWNTAPLPGAPFGSTFDPERYWSLTLESLTEAVAVAGVRPHQILGVAVTSQRLAIVALDRRGRPVMASPNVDARAVAEGFALEGRAGAKLYETTGHYPALVLAPAKLQWLRDREPRAFAKLAHVVPLAGYLAFRLTGDVSAERGHLADCGLLHIRSGAVPDDLLREAGLDPTVVPSPVEPGAAVGGLRRTVARACGLRPGTPVFAAAPDTQAALLGCGALDPGDAAVVAGWSAPAQVVTGEPRFDAERRTWTTVHPLPGRWIVESNATDAGRVWAWAVRLLVGGTDRAMRRAFAEASKAPPGAGDLTALLGPTVMGQNAMSRRLGGLVMPTPITLAEPTRGAVLRAVLEGVLFAIRGNVEQAATVAGVRCERLTLAGGLSRAPVFAQTLADILDRPVDVALTADAAALGAAICAAVGGGAFPSFAAARPMMAARHAVTPRPAASAAYADHYRRWLDLDSALTELGRSLQ